MKRIAASLALVLSLSCRKKDPEPQLTPTEVVTRYWTAVGAHDCATMEALAGGTVGRRLKEVGCDALIHAYREHKTELLAVENVEPDGRDPNAFIVRVRMKHFTQDASMATTTAFFRVARVGGKLRLVEI